MRDRRPNTAIKLNIIEVTLWQFQALTNFVYYFLVAVDFAEF